MKKIISILLAITLISACRDDFYEVNKPSWLGESIYEQLKDGYIDENGKQYTFNVFVKLIDDIGYDEVLKRTGSKTIFASDDRAFEAFFSSNDWNVKSYEALSVAQKKLIVNAAMINNAFLIELLSSTEGPVEGQALRRTTAISVLDTITFESGNNLPETPNWEYYKDKGLYVLKDNTPIPMLHFLQRQLDYNGVSNDDFLIIFNGKGRERHDAHIYGNKIVVRDITCKNGYINIMESVMIPPGNMAEMLRTAPETKLFSQLLERYSAPYYDPVATNQYKLINPDFNDSIFVKKYFAERSAGGSNILNPKGVGQLGYLEFDPGWNTYRMSNTAAMETDMAAIFAPGDEILNTFFYNGGGKFLIERYGSIDNIPNDVIDDLLRNHMKTSFLGAVPRRFPEVLDDGKEPMGIEKSDVIKSYVANNGVIYVTNKVYAPASFVAVIAPIIVNDQTRIFNWAVKNLQYNAYLLSMDSYYSFIVPVDHTEKYSEFGEGLFYIDPVSLAKPQPEIFKFWYNEKATVENDKVRATAYKYNPVTGEIGDSIRLATLAEIRDRLDDLVDNHIVVGNIENGRTYFQTKNGSHLNVQGNNVGMRIFGGGNIEETTPSVVEKIYDQTRQTNGRGNGKTYLVNTPLQTSYKSVYKVLSETPDFSEFFTLLQGNDEATVAESKKYDIFYRDPSYAGLDYNVKFFNTYHYTVYVPTNEAVLAAIAEGLPTWDIIKAETDQSKKTAMTEKLVNFLRYHFQDNSVYVDGTSQPISQYETAAFNINDINKSYYKVYTQLSPTGMKIYADPNDVSTAVNLTMQPGLYNIMAREYKFNNKDPQLATQIETSSYAVIHQIDKVLLFEKDQLKK